MTTESIDPHNTLFLLLNNHHRKSDERSWPFSKAISFHHHWAVWNHSGMWGITGRESYTCHLMLDSKCAFTLLNVINEEGAYMKGLSPASFHMWTGSLVRMITSLKAWSGGRLWENDYGLNLWLLSNGQWTLLLLLWWSKFLSLRSFYLLCFSLFGREIVFFISHGHCHLSSLYGRK